MPLVSGSSSRHSQKRKDMMGAHQAAGKYPGQDQELSSSENRLANEHEAS